MEKLGSCQRLVLRFADGCNTMDLKRRVFFIDTEQAYCEMQKANRIIEDFPIEKYALYTILFLAEIALCFAIIHYI